MEEHSHNLSGMPSCVYAFVRQSILEGDVNTVSGHVTYYLQQVNAVNWRRYCLCVCVLLQVGPCGEVRAYIISLWGVRDLSPTCGDPHKE